MNTNISQSITVLLKKRKEEEKPVSVKYGKRPCPIKETRAFCSICMLTWILKRIHMLLVIRKDSVTSHGIEAHSFRRVACCLGDNIAACEIVI